MLRNLSIRLAPVTSRAADYAPVAPACCNACRTCATTNLVGLAIGGLTATAFAVKSLARRVGGLNQPASR